MQPLDIQTLDVISVNIWSVLISIANLLIMFLILKKFLYKPLKKVLEERRCAVDRVYSAADEAKAAAEADRDAWARKMEGAEEEADRIVKNAEANAERRRDAIVEDANRKAEGILRRAEANAELERRKASEDIKKELVDVSSALAEKMLQREIRREDHDALIDSFLRDVGGDGDGTE
ncbi:MAG: F0F1 ATP synthase subunit B [Clostridia bacterium]|nr:F0F1 ATP synthase subunit B [Clostridia bacterium]